MMQNDSEIADELIDSQMRLIKAQWKVIERLNTVTENALKDNLDKQNLIFELADAASADNLKDAVVSSHNRMMANER